jgi:hypothetical protein
MADQVTLIRHLLLLCSADQYHSVWPTARNQTLYVLPSAGRPIAVDDRIVLGVD